MGAHRPGELGAMEKSLDSRGVTRCPTAVAVPTQGVILSKVDIEAMQRHSAELEARRSKKAKGMMAASKQREAEEAETPTA